MSELFNFVDINGNPFEEKLHVTTDSHGLMCPGDKAKLDTIEEGAQKNVQSDYTQNDSTADDYINNRPFYSNLIEYKWDGSSDGRDTFTYGDITYTKVSDDIYTEDELIANGGIYLDGNLNSSLTSDNFVGTTGQYSNLFWVCKSTSILVDPIFSISITVPSTGIYYTSELQTAYLAINDIKKIDKKFLPSIDYSEILNTPAIRKTNVYNAVALNNSNNKSTGIDSLAEGSGTEASGQASHAEGKNTIAAGRNQHAEGKYNIKDTSNKYAHIIGNGTSNSKRSNAYTVDWNGNAWYAGEVKIGGTGQDDTDAKVLATTEYVDTQIAAIPTPDVSGQISTHNTAADAHSDIRAEISELNAAVETLATTDLSNVDNDVFKTKVEQSGFSSGTKVQFITWEETD